MDTSPRYLMALQPCPDDGVGTLTAVVPQAAQPHHLALRALRDHNSDLSRRNRELAADLAGERSISAALILALQRFDHGLATEGDGERLDLHLTLRQRQVMDLVLDGHPSKNIAADLNISQRTVENHRAAIMRRTGAKSLPALARMVAGLTRCGDCCLRTE